MNHLPNYNLLYQCVLLQILSQLGTTRTILKAGDVDTKLLNLVSAFSEEQTQIFITILI